MGVNAQTTVPTFQASQILTADQMNQSARTGVPVFADTTARDAAFGGSGEKVLAEGQLCYLENTNVVQYYDGAAWATVGPQTPGALVFIKAETIGTAVSTVAVTNAFSSTYENYKIIISGGVASAGGDFRMILGATTAGYYSSAQILTYAGTEFNFTTANGAYYDFIGSVSTNTLNADITIFGPNLAKRTNVLSTSASASTGGESKTMGGFLNDANQYTGFTMSLNTGTMTGGTIRVYGIANS